MKKLVFALAMLFFSRSGTAQNIPAYSAEEIIAHTSAKDTVYIVNFWATWCVPCVQELPEFNALYERYSGMPVKILMVSLDFKEDYPYKLARFLERKKLKPNVAWLSDTDPNVFIPKIDNSWEGSIPATVVVAPGKGYKKFIEGSVTERQISSIVDKILSQRGQ
jgi:thiol-disulfide isomerase/thioredoxin